MRVFILLACLLLCLVVAVGTWWLVGGGAGEDGGTVTATDPDHGTRTDPDPAAEPTADPVTATAPAPAPDTDVDTATTSPSSQPGSTPKSDSGSPAPVLDPTLTTRGDNLSVAEAIRTRKHPERLMPLAIPPPFDPAAYKADPEAYLKVIEPGRVFQSGQPGPGMTAIRAVGETVLSPGNQGDFILAVTVPPGAPVTFHAFDFGVFANHLGTVSVKAGEDGIARVALYADTTPDSMGHVLAASPLATGRVEFLLTGGE